MADAVAVTLIHHSASRGREHPPSSPRAIHACLQARARIIEVDISPLADGRYALLHGPLLDGETTGAGPISNVTAAELAGFSYTYRGVPTAEPIGLLEGALGLIGSHSHLVELQLDLKPYVHLGDVELLDLIQSLRPYLDRIRVTCPADWVVRRLHHLDGSLPLGFDPLLYINLHPAHAGPGAVPPFRQGAYALWDDHPLAGWRWGSAADYMAARAEALWAQAPMAEVWYISAPLLAWALDQGFDWIGYLHAQGVQVDAWTLDADRPGAVELSLQLIGAGVDRITTNTPVELAAALKANSVQVVF